MPNEVAQFLIALVALVVLAVWLGAIAARLFMSASRDAPGADKR